MGFDREVFLIINKYACEVCGKPVTSNSSQIAHRINNGPTNKKYFGKEIIDHEFNKGIVCSLYCNAKLLIDNKTMQKMELVERIAINLVERDKSYKLPYKVEMELIKFNNYKDG